MKKKFSVFYALPQEIRFFYFRQEWRCAFQPTLDERKRTCTWAFHFENAQDATKDFCVEMFVAPIDFAGVPFQHFSQLVISRFNLLVESNQKFALRLFLKKRPKRKLKTQKH